MGYCHFGRECNQFPHDPWKAGVDGAVALVYFAGTIYCILVLNQKKNLWFEKGILIRY